MWITALLGYTWLIFDIENVRVVGILWTLVIDLGKIIIPRLIFN